MVRAPIMHWVTGPLTHQRAAAPSGSEAGRRRFVAIPCKHDPAIRELLRDRVGRKMVKKKCQPGGSSFRDYPPSIDEVRSNVVLRVARHVFEERPGQVHVVAGEVVALDAR